MQRREVGVAALVCFFVGVALEYPSTLLKSSEVQVQGYGADLNQLSKGLLAQRIVTGSSAGKESTL